MFALLTLGLMPATASPACEAACDRLLEEFQQTCDGDLCQVAGSAYGRCIDTCNQPLEIPGEDVLEAMARRHAEARWGLVYLIDSGPYLDRDGQPSSFVYIFADQPTSGGAVLDSLSLGSSGGPDLYGVEVGAKVDVPPIVAFWTGPSATYAAWSDMLDLLGPSATLVNRYGSAVFPTLQLDVDGATVYYDPRTNTAGQGFDIPPNDWHDSEPYFRRRGELELEWHRTLANLEVER